MKALLKKDFYVLTRQMKLFFVMVVVFSIMPGMNLSIFAIVYCGMLPYTALAYDERSKWDELAGMMPYSHGDMVLSKYVLGWTAVTAITILSLFANLVLGRILPSGYNATPASLLISLCLGFLMMDLTLPFMFRFGVEKGRIFFILMVVVLACGGAGLAGVIASGSGLPASLISRLSLLIPIATLVATVISVPLSIKLYAARLKG